MLKTIFMNMRKVMWIEAILGLWILFSPWVVFNSVLFSNVAAGILLILISCWRFWSYKTE